ncbi:MAG TPA: DinB family protein [Candidatus Dormibacteraeota bacterium]|nr:DinB family protein [Candidatus Dormibacteraeota bacterium]
MSNWSKLAGLALGLGLALVPVTAQEAAKKAPPKPAAGPAAAVLEQWNDIGRKLIAIAEDLPEDKYDYKPNPDSRTFRALLLHVSASMYYFTDPAQNKKPRFADDPKPADLKINNKADLVAFVKQCVKDGADVIQAKGDKGMSEAVNAGGPRLNRVDELAYGLAEHSGEHYGNLVVYYRINGMVPPESRPKK